MAKISFEGVAHWEFGACWGGPKNPRTVLWRRLLPGALHIPEIQPEAVHSVHVAGNFAHIFFNFLSKKPKNIFLFFPLFFRDVMPLKMRSQRAPTRLWLSILSTMAPRSRSEWSWGRSLVTSWPFSKANSSSLRYRGVPQSNKKKITCAHLWIKTDVITGKSLGDI